MFFPRIDLVRLRRDRASLASQCLDLKRALGRPWLAPMADTQRRLTRLRRALTELHVLLAWTRGRLHVRMPPRDLAPSTEPWDGRAWNARIAERVALDYPLATAAQEVAPS